MGGTLFSPLLQSSCITWESQLLNIFLTGKPGKASKIFSLALLKTATENWVTTLFFIRYVNQGNTVKLTLQTTKFPMLCKLWRISLTKFHTGAREKVISLTGKRYVIEETIHCIKEWGSKQQRDSSCLKGQFSSPHCHCHTLNSKGRHVLWHQRPLIF